ncbi:vitelline envelope sperm lysin receptor-like isoform X2 [Haliotis rufescens]|nr:vitelline envelope sperm lysin receptor-like isoform X2 [Haliotis rufescens]XP_046375340.2 vitelline envelope sperm lysin receptor-like isoform X2 [Haliotis rufescens]
MTAGWCLLSVLLGVTTAAIPKGYHLQVTPLCGTSIDKGAIVTIRTDLDVYANAFCQDQTPVEFDNVDSATFSLDLSYPGSKSPKDCVFRKRKGVDVFFIRVIVSFGEKGAEIHTEEEMFTVTCTFDPKGSKISGKKFVKGRILAPKEIKSNEGPKSKSKLKLILTDITRHSLMGKPINLGRKVLLIASTDGSTGEKGMRITSCDAVGTKSRYQVIRAGCGDGQVFNKTQGFVTTGLTAMSPYFDMFHLMNDKSVTFDCNFTLCNASCDGSSCANERRRRASDFVAPDTQKPLLINLAPAQSKNRLQRSAHEVEHVKLFLTNVAGFQLHNVSLQRGRPYVLHATTDGKKGEVGLQVMHCDIVTTKTQHNRRMAAIRDGCGVEPVFRPDKGFITHGLTATSPYFKGFEIRGDNSLAFQCNVILCHQNCDGRTCLHERPKRDLEKQGPFLESGNVQSASFVVNSRVKRSWWLKDMLGAARNRNL